MADQTTATSPTTEESAAPAQTPPAPPTPTVAPAPGMTAAGGSNAWVWGVGRRKASVARVRVKAGNGSFKINGRDVDDFFTEIQYRNDMWAPLEATNTKGQVDVAVRVTGGGTTGQAGAILLGLSRALKKYDSQLEQALRDANFLTRDARVVERKKYGQPGARRRFQFSKR